MGESDKAGDLIQVKGIKKKKKKKKTHPILQRHAIPSGLCIIQPDNNPKLTHAKITLSKKKFENYDLAIAIS